MTKSNQPNLTKPKYENKSTKTDNSKFALSLAQLVILFKLYNDSKLKIIKLFYKNFSLTQICISSKKNFD